MRATRREGGKEGGGSRGQRRVWKGKGAAKKAELGRVEGRTGWVGATGTRTGRGRWYQMQLEAGAVGHTCNPSDSGG